MMKRFFVFGVIFFLAQLSSFQLFSQNLLANPSFENGAVPYSHSQIDFADDWDDTDWGGSHTADYFDCGSPVPFCVHRNDGGNITTEFAHSGGAYVGMQPFEAFRQKLSNKLDKFTPYYVSIYVRRMGDGDLYFSSDPEVEEIPISCRNPDAQVPLIFHLGKSKFEYTNSHTCRQGHYHHSHSGSDQVIVMDLDLSLLPEDRWVKIWASFVANDNYDWIAFETRHILPHVGEDGDCDTSGCNFFIFDDVFLSKYCEAGCGDPCSLVQGPAPHPTIINPTATAPLMISGLSNITYVRVDLSAFGGPFLNLPQHEFQCQNGFLNPLQIELPSTLAAGWYNIDIKLRNMCGSCDINRTLTYEHYIGLNNNVDNSEICRPVGVKEECCESDYYVDDLELSSTGTNVTFAADQDLFVSTIGDVSLNNLSDIDFTASNNIYFGAGFETFSGAEMHAYMEPCNASISVSNPDYEDVPQSRTIDASRESVTSLIKTIDDQHVEIIEYSVYSVNGQLIHSHYGSISRSDVNQKFVSMNLKPGIYLIRTKYDSGEFKVDKKFKY